MKKQKLLRELEIVLKDKQKADYTLQQAEKRAKETGVSIFQALEMVINS